MAGRKPIDEQSPIGGASEKKVLLAGPVARIVKSGRTYVGYPEAATYLRHLFVTVLDPSDVMLSATANTPYRDHVDHHLRLFSEADGVVTLPGWEGSILAQVVVSLAHGCQLPVLHLDPYGGLAQSEWGTPDEDLAWLRRRPEGRKIL